MEKTAETTCRALILSVMVRMMEVDGFIDEREVKRIGDLYEEIAGFRLSNRIREKLIGSVTVTRTGLLDLLQTRSGLMDESCRERVFRAARLVLEADARRHPREWRFLRDIGLALGMSDDEIEASIGAG